MWRKCILKIIEEFKKRGAAHDYGLLEIEFHFHKRVALTPEEILRMCRFFKIKIQNGARKVIRRLIWINLRGRPNPRHQNLLHRNTCSRTRVPCHVEPMLWRHWMPSRVELTRFGDNSKWERSTETWRFLFQGGIWLFNKNYYSFGRARLPIITTTPIWTSWLFPVPYSKSTLTLFLSIYM